MAKVRCGSQSLCWKGIKHLILLLGLSLATGISGCTMVGYCVGMGLHSIGTAMAAPFHEGEEYEWEEDHGAMDPHIWLSPLNAKIMVQNIYEGLVQVDPGNRAYYEQNRDTYLQKLTKLDQDIREDLSRVNNRKFMVYHPAFGYFAKEYNLTLLPIEAEGKEPTAVGMAHLIEQAKEHNIRVIFASPQFNPQSAEVIAKAIDGRVVFIDSLARDYIVNMRLLLGELIQAME